MKLPLTLLIRTNVRLLSRASVSFGSSLFWRCSWMFGGLPAHLRRAGRPGGGGVSPEWPCCRPAPIRARARALTVLMVESLEAKLKGAQRATWSGHDRTGRLPYADPRPPDRSRTSVGQRDP